MKIALVHPYGTFSPYDISDPSNLSDSLSIVTYELARHLAINNKVIVYSWKGVNQEESEFYQGVQYRRIASQSIIPMFEYLLSRIYNMFYRSFGFNHPSLFKNPPFSSKLYFYKYGLQVAKDLKRQKCDIVHVHQYSHFVPIIRRYNPEIKIVLHMHCEWLTQLNRKMIENRIKDADLIIGCSEFITEDIRHHFPQFADRCRTVHNGIDLDYFDVKNDQLTPEKNEAFNLLFVGRVSPEKGLHVLFEAFSKVLEQYPKVQLTIVGAFSSLGIEFFLALSDDPVVSELKAFYKGDYVSHLKNILSPKMAGNVSFTGPGPVPRRELPRFYRDSTVFIFPPIWNEPFGIPVLEAMASGIPVVSTLSGGIKETVDDGETGLLVEKGSAPALADAILQILSDNKLRESMRIAARKRAVELFSWEKITKDLLSHYKLLVISN